jgi:hypothetical protein
MSLRLFLHSYVRYLSCPCRYQQYFDLEGESGIVVRGIGTCVFLKKMYAASSPSTPTSFTTSPRDDTDVQEL